MLEQNIDPEAEGEGSSHRPGDDARARDRQRHGPLAQAVRGARPHQLPGHDRRRHGRLPAGRVATPRPSRRSSENDKGDLVLAGRLGLQDAMRNAMIATVETTLGRRVRSFMSANDLDRTSRWRCSSFTVRNRRPRTSSRADPAAADAPFTRYDRRRSGTPSAAVPGFAARRWEADGGEPAGANRRTTDLYRRCVRLIRIVARLGALRDQP